MRHGKGLTAGIMSLLLMALPLMVVPQARAQTANPVPPAASQPAASQPAASQPIAAPSNAAPSNGAQRATGTPAAGSTQAKPLVSAPDTGQNPSDPILGGGYVLGANDRLRLIVFGEENLSGEFQIDSGGNVSLPLIGETRASGLEVRALARAIEKRLSDGYLRDPKVSIEVLSARPFYILGEVQRAGQYPFVSGMTAPNAVATAGGFAPLADQTRVLIKRAGQAEELELPLGAETAILPGDTVRIVKGAFFILGEVNAPGEYPYTQGLSVLQAVATAKGFSYRANRGRAFIQRAGELVEKSYKINPSLTLGPGDTVRIGERLF